MSQVPCSRLIDHGLGGVKQGAVAHAYDVGGDDLVGVVAEGFGGLCLDLRR